MISYKWTGPTSCTENWKGPFGIISYLTSGYR